MSDYISENTLIQILKYLPVRSLLRFRSVCKWWKELVDSEEFMQAHLAVQKPQFFVQCRVDPEFSAVELRSPPLVHTLTTAIDGKSFSPLGTLHGVVCLSDGDRKILLWNPSIRKFSTIPLPLAYVSYTCSKESISCNGFWIDPSTKEFKIIILVFGDNLAEEQLNVNGILYSSIKHDWTAIPLAELENWAPSSYYADPPVMIAGMAHWKGRYEFGIINARAILCFDFAQESFEFIEMPYDGDIIQWQGKLSFLHWRHTFPQRCEVYTRQEGLWIKVFSFGICSPETAYFSVLMLGETERRFWVLFQTLTEFITHRDGGMCGYNLRLYDPRVGCIPLINDNSYRTLAYDFVESLLSP